MCGIVGIYNLNQKNVDINILKSMANVLKHRGPDDEGDILLDNGSLGLAHKRLSIIDLTKAAQQPMSNENGSIWIIQNGEIYNYIELREELLAKGHIFKSRSDTEVILHSYEEKGVDCLQDFVGMWAFAIWDSKRRILFCARDRLGKKPFYYFFDKDSFIFASEIKALLKNPLVGHSQNDRAIFRYLYQAELLYKYNRYCYMDVSDETFFANIKQILPGYYLILKDKNLNIKKYWSLNFSQKIFYKNEQRYFDEFRQIFEDAVKLRLRSDVPLGAYLSGGLDSSSVVSMIKRLSPGMKMKVFTAYFEGTPQDERKYAQIVARDTDLEWQAISPSKAGLIDDLEDIIRSMDQPFTDLSIYPQWAIMKQARQNDLRIILNGHGGDESLGGYTTNFPYLFADLFRQGNLGSLRNEMAIFSERYHIPRYKSIFQALNIMLNNCVSTSIKSKLKRILLHGNGLLNRDFLKQNINNFTTEQNCSFPNFLDINSYFTIKLYPLPFWLHSEDRVSMAFSIESRSPFLDHRLMEYCARLPYWMKIKNGVTKYILRGALKDILPYQIKNRFDKKGFTAPIQDWLMEKNEFISDILHSDTFARRPYFEHKNILVEYRNFCQRRRPLFFPVVWSWLNLELWLREFIDKDYYIYR